MLCRHVLVEPSHTQTMYLALKQRGWTRHGAPIQSIDGRNGIPLSEEAPSVTEISALFEWAVTEVLHITTIPVESLIESYTRFLDENGAPPSPFPPHDVLGDIILLRVGSEQKQSIESGNISIYTGAAKILLERQKKIRAVFVDLGVTGPYRQRNLIPLIARDKDHFVFPDDDVLENNPDIFSTRTTVRADGVSLLVDPAKAYYNPRLEGQRREFIDRLHAFSSEIGRPLRIADPYCGVGPMLLSIIHHRVPLHSLLGSDINPAAIELAHLNMPSNTSIPINIFEGRAKNVAIVPERQGTMDVICCNLPRSGSVAFVDPLPLLRPGGLLIGWIHAPAESSELLTITLRKDFQCETVTCRETRSYSSTESVYMVEARF